MSIVWKIIYLILSYLFGAIPFSYIVGKLMANIDIRRTGSGNVGSTNLFRSVGTKGALIAFILDAGKGFLVVSLAKTTKTPIQFLFLSGLLCVLGHIFTPYLNFKGGKGVATSFGIILGISPLIALILLIIFSIVFAASRIVSLSSISSALALVPLNLIMNQKLSFYMAFLTILILFTHRENIKRLLKGAERRLI